MTDLINKVDNMVENDLETIQGIVTKYSSVLQDVLPEKNVPYVAFLVDICVTYLQGSHGATDADWKAWCVVLIKKLFEAGKIENEEDVVPIIDEFLDYKAEEFEKWCKDIISVSDYERDRGFMYKFFWEKNK